MNKAIAIEREITVYVEDSVVKLLIPETLPNSCLTTAEPGTSKDIEGIIPTKGVM
jgi:hypothetical protein